MSDDPNGVRVTLDRTQEFLKSIGDLVQQQVLVGIPASGGLRAGTGDHIGNAALGYIHENGSPIRNIPARPFLYPTINRLQERAAAMLQQAAAFQMASKPGEARNTLEALGLMAAAEVKKTIVAGEGFEPLRPATIAARVRRGNTSEKPLIDTGQLLAAITYVVRRK